MGASGGPEFAGPTRLARANKLLADDNKHFPTVSYISPSSEMRITPTRVVGEATKIDERSDVAVRKPGPRISSNYCPDRSQRHLASSWSIEVTKVALPKEVALLTEVDLPKEVAFPTK